MTLLMPLFQISTQFCGSLGRLHTAAMALVAVTCPNMLVLYCPYSTIHYSTCTIENVCGKGLDDLLELVRSFLQRKRNDNMALTVLCYFIFGDIVKHRACL